MVEQILDFLIPAAYAQQGGPGPGQPAWLPLIWLAFIPAIFFLMIRPQMKRNKELKQMSENLAKGDEIVTGGGLAGRITGIGEVYLTVEIADGVQVKVQKSAVGSVLPKGTLKSL
ncbi:MAG: preprotein translocase subunit YajC [Nevskia sp.]|nr:preprotein translocase subunit YajC [Nevskia sp.]